MASSRVVLSPLGWSAILGGLAALLLGLVTLNLLLLVVPLAVLALTTGEILAFDRATREFGPSWFRWQRFENSTEVRLDGVGSMALDLERVGRSSVYLEVYDPHPETFDVVLGSPRLVTWCPGPARMRLAYVYRPRQRGRFRVGPTIVVAHDPLGFGFRMTKLENRWEVLVTPAISVEEQMVIPPGLRGQTEAFRRRVGSGSEFRSLREYQPSDDARRIAWRRSAVEKVYVREHEEEAHPEILVLLDTGWDMRMGMPGEESLEQGVEGGMVIAGQALARSDKVGLLTYSDRLVEFVPPQAGVSGAHTLTEAFGRVALAPAPFDIAGALATARERLTTPTVIVLLSTLLFVDGPVENAVADLRVPGHRLITLSPEVNTLFPPVADGLPSRTLDFARGPVDRQVAKGVGRMRDAGATVVQYPVPYVREFAAELLAWITSQGGSS
ncbi:MAG TPA: DUF58 domain-containing protein [Thermoplasmata archaeon]|nr:DUF58 domain-containing protein [Thermoplasmata archaeon]